MIGRGPPPPRARGGGPTHLGAAILVIPFLKSRLVQIVGQHRGTVYLDQAVHGPFIAKNTPKVNSINTKVEIDIETKFPFHSAGDLHVDALIYGCRIKSMTFIDLGR